MIGISTPTFDLDGSLRLEELRSSELDAVERRISRVKTLDGGVAVNDTGHSAGDRSFMVRWRVDRQADYLAAARLVRLYPRLTVTTREGVFTAAPERINLRGRQAEMMLLVLDQQA